MDLMLNKNQLCLQSEIVIISLFSILENHFNACKFSNSIHTETEKEIQKFSESIIIKGQIVVVTCT